MASFVLSYDLSFKMSKTNCLFFSLASPVFSGDMTSRENGFFKFFSAFKFKRHRRVYSVYRWPTSICDTKGKSLKLLIRYRQEWSEFNTVGRISSQSKILKRWFKVMIQTDYTLGRTPLPIQVLSCAVCLPLPNTLLSLSL